MGGASRLLDAYGGLGDQSALVRVLPPWRVPHDDIELRRRVDGKTAAMSRASRMPRLVKLTSVLVCELLALVAVLGCMHWLRTSPHSYAVAIGVSCIIPVMTIAVFTAHRFWHDRRPPSAHGQHCGYNLTGNASGISSECGTDA